MARKEFTAGEEMTADKLNKAIIAGSYNAGETIAGATLPVPVYQNTTDNEFYACDANVTAKLNFAGFAITDGVDGGAIDIQLVGIVKGFTALAEGEKYYVQDAVGTIGTAKGTYKLLVGIAISETELLILKRPIENNHFIGAGDYKPKSYWNFAMPFISNSIAWTASNVTGNYYCISWFNSDVAADSNWYVLSTQSVFVGANGNSLHFNVPDIIVEFGVDMSAVGDDQSGFGLANVLQAFQDADDQVADAVCFTVGVDGTLYAHTSNAGVGHTEVTITGITLTVLNAYRIEFNHGVNAKFYVNGVLRATITTNLPDSEPVKFGFGGTGNSNVPSTITVPQFSVLK